MASAAPSSSSPRTTFHLFLSFRGGDTRKTFTDHLYASLTQSGFHTFRDDDAIPRGGHIETEIRTAILRSRMSLLVLSNDYASSRWCLDELSLIMDRKKTVGHMVLPVFVDVDPSDVRNQTGRYGEAFAKHEMEFKEEMEMVEGWRNALKEAADMDGMVLENRYMSQFIQDIVRVVGNKLKRPVLNVASYLVGMESRIADVNLWLQDRSDDVEIGIIYGVGGIGKTTVAKTIYNQNFDRFEGRSFLANVRETSEQHNGLVRLQRQLLSDLLKGKVNKIYSVDEGIVKIKDVVCRKRILLVLDDVDQLEQFNAIVGMRKWFCRGSKIIVTTRYEDLLKAQGVSKMFGVNKLDDEESIKLFSWHAFGQDHPVEGYIKHSESAIHLCSGLPLALQVLGSSLSGKTIDVWQSALQKLEAIPDSKIQKILRVSYDSLEDDHDKSIFLDVACFFTGMGKDYVVTILNGCGFYSIIGIHNLVDRCLVSINEDNKLMMHQLLRDMGREIVRQESPEDLGKRSRLWRHRDAFTVLKDSTGTEAIKGLTLSRQMLAEKNYIVLDTKRSRYEDTVKLKTKAFVRMDRLKLLQLNNVEFNGDYRNFPKSLVWLFWRGFSLKSLPSNLHMENLVALDMRDSSLTNVWKGMSSLSS